MGVRGDPSGGGAGPIGLDDLTILAALCMYANEIGPAEDLAQGTWGRVGGPAD